MKDLIAYCGLDCEKCEAFIATKNKFSTCEDCKNIDECERLFMITKNNKFALKNLKNR